MSNKYTSEEEVEEVPKEDFLQQYSTKDAYVVEQLRKAMMKQYHTNFSGA